MCFCIILTQFMPTVLYIGQGQFILLNIIKSFMSMFRQLVKLINYQIKIKWVSFTAVVQCCSIKNIHFLDVVYLILIKSVKCQFGKKEKQQDFGKSIRCNAPEIWHVIKRNIARRNLQVSFWNVDKKTITSDIWQPCDQSLLGVMLVTAMLRHQPD